MPTPGEETVQLPASVLEKMQAQIAALSSKVGLQEEEILDPAWPKTVYRQTPGTDAEEHDYFAWKASFESMRVDADGLAAALKDGWTQDVPKCWHASWTAPKVKKVKSKD